MYKGVVAPGQFSAMVDELIAGPCVVVEVRGEISTYRAVELEGVTHECIIATLLWSVLMYKTEPMPYQQP